MTNAIIPLTGNARLPAYLANRDTLAAINAEVLSGGRTYPVMSIKGKVFTLVKGSERKVLVRDDDPDETLQSIQASVLRANTKSRVFYAKSYTEGAEADSGPPDCYSSDGVVPGADARNPQASKCAMCPHSVWGSRSGTEGKGTACTVNTRLAVVDPTRLDSEVEPFLLRVPAGSRSNFAEVVKTAQTRGIPYNALVLKIAFDKEAPSPKLTFRIVGLLDDGAYAKASGLYEDETVKDIVGLAPVTAAPAAAHEAPSETQSDLDAALAAKNARESAADAAKTAVARAAGTRQAPPQDEGDDPLAALNLGGAPAEPPAPAPAPAPAAPRRRAAAPKPAEAPAAAAPPAQAAAVATADDDLLGGLDALLGSSDD